MISNIKHLFFKNGLFKQHFVVQKICLSQSVCSFKKAICIPHDKIPLKKMLFSFGRNKYYFVECHIILLGNSCMPQIQHFLKKMLVFLWTDVFISNFKVQFFIVQCNRLREATFLYSCKLFWKTSLRCTSLSNNRTCMVEIYNIFNADPSSSH